MEEDDDIYSLNSSFTDKKKISFNSSANSTSYNLINENSLPLSPIQKLRNLEMVYCDQDAAHLDDSIILDSIQGKLNDKVKDLSPEPPEEDYVLNFSSGDDVEFEDSEPDVLDMDLDTLKMISDVDVNTRVHLPVEYRPVRKMREVDPEVLQAIRTPIRSYLEARTVTPDGARNSFDGVYRRDSETGVEEVNLNKVEMPNISIPYTVFVEDRHGRSRLGFNIVLTSSYGSVNRPRRLAEFRKFDKECRSS